MLDLVMSLAALATPLLFLYQTFWRPCYEFLLKQDAEPDEQHTLHSLAALTGENNLYLIYGICAVSLEYYISSVSFIIAQVGVTTVLRACTLRAL